MTQHFVRPDELDDAIGWRDAELTRLRAEADRMAEAIELYQTRERSWFGECTLTHGWQHGQCLLCTINRLRAELAEARALVEKREAQIACLVRRPWGSHRHTDIDGVDSWEIHKLGFGDVPTLRVIQYDGTRAGLLAAVDEATKS